MGPNGVLHSNNFMNELITANQHYENLENVRGHTAAFRNFNIGSITLFVIFSIFLIIFFGDLAGAQVGFYFVFVAFTVANVVFYTVKP